MKMKRTTAKTVPTATVSNDILISLSLSLLSLKTEKTCISCDKSRIFRTLFPLFLLHHRFLIFLLLLLLLFLMLIGPLLLPLLLLLLPLLLLLLYCCYIAAVAVSLPGQNSSIYDVSKMTTILQRQHYR